MKPCSQGSAVATCSPSGWTRIRFYPALAWLCNTHHAFLDETACHHQLWSAAYCPLPSTCCVSCLHEVGLSAIRGHRPVTLPLAALHDPCMHPPQGKGEMVSSADADRVPWTPKRKAGVGDRGEGHPGHLTAGMGKVSRTPWFSIFI